MCSTLSGLWTYQTAGVVQIKNLKGGFKFKEEKKKVAELGLQDYGCNPNVMKNLKAPCVRFSIVFKDKVSESKIILIPIF